MSGIPYVKGSATSKAAAESMVKHAPTARARIFQFILERGEYGATDDEIETALGMSHQTASARRYKLHREGALVRTDWKRPTRTGRQAFVYQAVEGFDIGAKQPGRPPKAARDRRDVKVTAYLTKDQHAGLCWLAAEEGRTTSELMREAIGGYVSSNLPYNHPRHPRNQ